MVVHYLEIFSNDLTIHQELFDCELDSVDKYVIYKEQSFREFYNYNKDRQVVITSKCFTAPVKSITNILINDLETNLKDLATLKGKIIELIAKLNN